MKIHGVWKWQRTGFKWNFTKYSLCLITFCKILQIQLFFWFFFVNRENSRGDQFIWKELPRVRPGPHWRLQSAHTGGQGTPAAGVQDWLLLRTSLLHGSVHSTCQSYLDLRTFTFKPFKPLTNVLADGNIKTENPSLNT